MTVTPRPYQRDAYRACLDHLARHGSTLLVLPTGCGKTVVFSLVARHYGEERNTGVLVLSHRTELVEQAAASMRRICGSCEVEQADKWASPDARYVSASIPTLAGERGAKRLRRWPPDRFGLVVVDEAHHGVADSYRDVLTYFAQAGGHVLGVTATPKRADELALGQVFRSCCYEYAVADAVSDAYLVPIRCSPVALHGVDFSDMAVVAGDLSAGQIEATMVEEKPLHGVVDPSLTLVGERPTIWFVAGVAQAERTCEVVNRHHTNGRTGMAAWVSGETDFAKRTDTFEAFRAGRLQHLVNVGICTEGTDLPTVAALVMARPTKSESLYCQMLGRSVRTLPGVIDPYAEGTPQQRRSAIANSAKPDALVIDFTVNSGRHKLMRATDVLGGRYGSPVRDYARRAVDSGTDADPEHALQRAQIDLAFMADQEAWEARDRARRDAEARRAFIRGTASYSVGSVDVFDRADRPNTASPRPSGGPRLPPPTKPQLDRLAQFRVPQEQLARLNIKTASDLLGRLIAEARARRAGGG